MIRLLYILCIGGLLSFTACDDGRRQQSPESSPGIGPNTEEQDWDTYDTDTETGEERRFQDPADAYQDDRDADTVRRGDRPGAGTGPGAGETETPSRRQPQQNPDQPGLDRGGDTGGGAGDQDPVPPGRNVPRQSPGEHEGGDRGGAGPGTQDERPEEGRDGAGTRGDEGAGGTNQGAGGTYN
jgi:hypothetical protein